MTSPSSRQSHTSPDSSRARANGVARLLLTRQEAAASLGVSVDFFEEHVQGDLRLVRRGRLVLVPVKELERWVDRAAARTLEP
jgi:excisionase family DNA binding protein